MTNSIDSVAGVDDFATMVKDLMAERDKLQADLAAARARVAELESERILLVKSAREAWDERSKALDLANNCRNRAERAEAEPLRHDVERHVRIASEQATEIGALRALLMDAKRFTPLPTSQRIDAALKEQK